MDASAVIATSDLPLNYLKYRALLVSLLAFQSLGLFTGCTATNRATRDAAKLVAARQLTLRGMDAVQQNDWETAENLFREAVAASPHDERAHLQFAKTLWHRGERREAVHHMGEAVRLSGEAAELLVELGRMQLALGDLDAAKQSGVQAARTDPQFAAAHALVGDVLAQQGRLDQALGSYHLALSLDPRQPHVTLAVADIYRIWDEPRRMLSTLQPLATADLPPALAARAYFLRGVSEGRLNRYRDAIASLERSAQLVPGAEVYFELAEAREQLGDVEGAKLALQAALQQDPHHEPSQSRLAQLNALPRFGPSGTVLR